MKKRILILTLLSSLLLSTTGIPLTVSFCKLSSSHISGQCIVRGEKLNNHSCCNKNQDDDHIKIRETDTGSCCKLKIVNNNITDKFLTLTVNSYSKNFANKFVVSKVSEDESGIFNSYKHISKRTLPTLLHNHIYLDNSILII